MKREVFNPRQTSSSFDDVLVPGRFSRNWYKKLIRSVVSFLSGNDLDTKRVSCSRIEFTIILFDQAKNQITKPSNKIVKLDAQLLSIWPMQLNQ